MVAQANSLGQNSLHLALDWPKATAFLLSISPALLHKPDRYGIYPISYACTRGTIETVKIFLANGSYLLTGQCSSYKSSALKVCERYFDQRIVEAIVLTLARRRADLLAIARKLLPKESLEEIIASDETLPDASALKLYKAVVEAELTKGDLESYRCLGLHNRIPDGEWSAVYHVWNGPAAGAEILYNAGFTSIWTKDLRGRHPLNFHRSLDDLTYVKWFSQKTAPFAEIADFSTVKGHQNTNPNIHWLILQVCEEIFYVLNLENNITTSEEHDLADALQILCNGEFASCVDNCQCHCSLNGCKPVAILLKTLEERSKCKSSKAENLAFFCRDTQLVLARLQEDPSWSKTGLVSQSFLRFTLFKMLDLRHTCCTAHLDREFQPRYIDEDIDEIMEEDEALVQKFQDLLPLAESKWRNTSKSWTRFWRDFYLDHIYNRSDDTEEIDDRYIDNLVALGVTIEETDRTGHHCTWLCYFEQLPKVYDKVQTQQGNSAKLIQSQHPNSFGRADVKMEDPAKPDEICPFYNGRKRSNQICSFFNVAHQRGQKLASPAISPFPPK